MRKKHKLKLTNITDIPLKSYCGKLILKSTSIKETELLTTDGGKAYRKWDKVNCSDCMSAFLLKTI